MNGLESLIPTKGHESGTDESILDEIEKQNVIIKSATERIYNAMCDLYPIGRKVVFKRGNRATRGSVFAVLDNACLALFLKAF